MRVNKIHYGYNIRRLREITGLKQSALAKQMGSGWSQKKISKLESREWINPALLHQVAGALGLPPEAIENFNEEVLLNILRQSHCATLEKSGPNRMATLENLRKENRALFAHLLKAEKDKNTLLRCIVEQHRRQVP